MSSIYEKFNTQVIYHSKFNQTLFSLRCYQYCYFEEITQINHIIVMKKDINILSDLKRQYRYHPKELFNVFLYLISLNGAYFENNEYIFC